MEDEGFGWMGRMGRMAERFTSYIHTLGSFFHPQDSRFAFGFTVLTLCVPMMRLWHFNRSRSCGSSSFFFEIDEDENQIRSCCTRLYYNLID